MDLVDFGVRYNKMKSTVDGLKSSSACFVTRNTNFKAYQELFHFFDTLILNQLQAIGCKTWVAGGAIREYFLNKKVTTDIDLYFANEKDFNLAKQYFLSKEFYPKNLQSVFIVDKVVAFANRSLANITAESEMALKLELNGVHFDLVKNFRTDEFETVDSFDFTVCGAAVSFECFAYHPEFFPDMLTRTLRLNSLHHPLSTLYRIQKYIKYGFTIPEQDLYTLAVAIKDTPIAAINPIDFLFDQLENPNGITTVKKYTAGTNGNCNEDAYETVSVNPIVTQRRDYFSGY